MPGSGYAIMSLPGLKKNHLMSSSTASSENIQLKLRSKTTITQGLRIASMGGVPRPRSTSDIAAVKLLEAESKVFKTRSHSHYIALDKQSLTTFNSERMLDAKPLDLEESFPPATHPASPRKLSDDASSYEEDVFDYAGHKSEDGGHRSEDWVINNDCTVTATAEVEPHVRVENGGLVKFSRHEEPSHVTVTAKQRRACYASTNHSDDSNSGRANHSTDSNSDSDSGSNSGIANHSTDSNSGIANHSIDSDNGTANHHTDDCQDTADDSVDITNAPNASSGTAIHIADSMNRTTYHRSSSAGSSAGEIPVGVGLNGAHNANSSQGLAHANGSNRGSNHTNAASISHRDSVTYSTNHSRGNIPDSTNQGLYPSIEVSVAQPIGDNLTSRVTRMHSTYQESEYTSITSETAIPFQTSLSVDGQLSTGFGSQTSHERLNCLEERNSTPASAEDAPKKVGGLRANKLVSVEGVPEGVS